MLERISAFCLLAGPALLFWFQGGNHSSVGWFGAATLGLGIAIWLLSKSIGGPNISLPRIPLICGGIALAIGLLGVLQPPDPIADPFVALHQAALKERWPSTGLAFSPFAWWSICALGWISALAGIDLLKRHPQWIQPAASTLVLSVCGFALIATHHGGAVEWMFLSEPAFSGHPFGGFFHYSLAAALFNLCWPVALALALHTGMDALATSSLRQWLFCLCFSAVSGFLFVTIFILTNRAAQVAAALGMAVFSLMLLLRLRSYFDDRKNWPVLPGFMGQKKVGNLLGGLTLLAVGWIAFHLSDRSFQWGSLEVPPPTRLLEPLPDRGDFLVPSESPHSHLPFFPRRLSWATAATMLPDAGFLGFGPGAWSYRYSDYTGDTMMLSFPLHIHFVYNDSLRYLVEWGWIGGLAWIVFWLWVLARGGRHALKSALNGKVWTRLQWIQMGAWTGLVTCLIHGLVDFPLQSPGVFLAAMLMAVLATVRPSSKSCRETKSGLT